MRDARQAEGRRRVLGDAAAGRRCGMLLLCALATGGWLGAERDRAAEGNRHYDAGRYGEAATSYGEGLVDYPESRRLRFNLGAAQYREGKFADAITTLEKLLSAADDEPRLADDAAGLSARAAYNVGNARFRLGQRLEEQDPQQALALYDQALADYKRSMGLSPEDEAPKFNHEFVERHLLALKERLEKQQQEQQEQQQQQQQGEQQEQQQGEQQEQQQGQEPQSGAEPSNDEEQADSERQPEPAQEPGAANGAQQEERDAAAEPQGGREEADAAEPTQGAPSPQGGGTAASDAPTTEETGRSEAQALIDTARGEEIEPSELRPLASAAGIGEPARDW